MAFGAYAQFAFCFPHSYTDTMAKLAWLDSAFGLPPAPVSAAATVAAPAAVEAEAASSNPAAAALTAALAAAGSPAGESSNPRADQELANAAVASAALDAPVALATSAGIYYHRELLTRSLDGRRIDLLTISSANNMDPARDAPLPEITSAGLPTAASEGGERAHAFADKPVFLLTARVHPGESPASHVFDGLLSFLLSTSDPRARALREAFVFKLVPMINPDGVYRGHYRADSRGVNLNRVYGAPSAEEHPAVYAIAALVRSLHATGALRFYIDCHAHSNKRGCFLFGNAISDAEAMASNVMYAKIVEANCRWFDFDGCV